MSDSNGWGLKCPNEECPNKAKGRPLERLFPICFVWRPIAHPDSDSEEERNASNPTEIGESNEGNKRSNARCIHSTSVLIRFLFHCRPVAWIFTICFVWRLIAHPDSDSEEERNPSNPTEIGESNEGNERSNARSIHSASVPIRFPFHRRP